ncbi:hypothetical protein [Bosea sp. BH3]|uniref:hypothetical protein n=1 Tax=Bosea sp. BH3 TaxID=2871701 RepID=UPI0021CB9374|nr:hypothetical protein [Bosea sp. BH3]MCU4180861.1 hypothetical protein [Bosea sp. BH3]
MEIIILALLAFAGYQFFRTNTRAGREAIRAYLFLERVNQGKSARDGNAFVDAALHDLGSDMATISIGMAKRAYAEVHGGKVLAVVGYAYRQGLRPAMPFWYGIIAQMAPVTRAIEVTYGRARPATREADGLQVNEGALPASGSAAAARSLDRAPSEAEFQQYYRALIAALKQKSGPTDTYDRDVEMMVEMYGDGPFREAFRDGIMPESLADVFIQKLSKAGT